jgi:hypothetical protein
MAFVSLTGKEGLARLYVVILYTPVLLFRGERSFTLHPLSVLRAWGRCRLARATVVISTRNYSQFLDSYSHSEDTVVLSLSLSLHPMSVHSLIYPVGQYISQAVVSTLLCPIVVVVGVQVYGSGLVLRG